MKQQERYEDQEEALRIMLSGFQAALWTALPCIVTKFDAVKQTCELQPTIQGKKIAPDGSSANINLPVLVDVPVYRLRGGGFSATVPLVAGDEGLAVFSSRCMDAWYQSGGIQPQFELRMHDLSDGFFLPGFNSQPKKLTAFATDALELRNDAGDVKVSVKEDRIICTAKNSTMTLKQDEIDIVATTVKITGDLEVSGMTKTGGGAQFVKLADGSNATKLKSS